MSDTEKLSTEHDDVTLTTDRFVRLSDPGGCPTIELRPTTLAEVEFEGEVLPAEPVVKFTFPDGRYGKYRVDALQAALDAVERLRSDA